MTLAQIANKAIRSVNANSPILLTGLAVAGVVSTAIFAVRATPQAVRLVSEAEVRHLDAESYKPDDQPYAEFSTLQIVQAAWKVYLPTAGMGLATILCIIGAQSINTRRQAALVGGFTIAETSLREYRDKVIELEGSKLDQKVRDAVQQDRVLADPSSNEIIILGSGNVLCYDKYSGRYFESSMEDIRKAQNDLNEAMINGDMYASLNELYQRIGLPITKMGEGLGFSTERLVDINFSSVLTERGEPCLAIDFRAEPMQDYYRFR